MMHKRVLVDDDVKELEDEIDRLRSEVFILKQDLDRVTMERNYRPRMDDYERVKAKGEERKAILLRLRYSGYGDGGVLSSNGCLFCGLYGSHRNDCDLARALED